MSFAARLLLFAWFTLATELVAVVTAACLMLR
jgi:hypothetical protein